MKVQWKEKKKLSEARENEPFWEPQLGEKVWNREYVE